MSDLKPCPFGSHEHYPRIETDELDEAFPDGDKWGAIAICDEHSFNIYGFGQTETEALDDLKANWNTRYERTCRNLQREQWGSEYDDDDGFQCSECGHNDDQCGEPNYCPSCGVKVVSP